MPIIFIYGVPGDHDVPELEKLMDRIKKTTSSVEELKISTDNISVFFPPDLVSAGLGEEIVVMVEGLFDKPERTTEVRQDLANRLALLVYEFFPRAAIEVLVKKFTQNKDGFRQLLPRTA